MVKKKNKKRSIVNKKNIISKSKKQGVVKDPQVLEMLAESKDISNLNHILADFWNNTSMSRVLDILIENKDIWINIGDMLVVGDLSRKSVRVNTDILLEKGIIEKKIEKYYTFFKWNKDNEQAKHLEKLRNILI